MSACSRPRRLRVSPPSSLPSARTTAPSSCPPAESPPVTKPCQPSGSSRASRRASTQPQPGVDRPESLRERREVDAARREEQALACLAGPDLEVDASTTESGEALGPHAAVARQADDNRHVFAGVRVAQQPGVRSGTRQPHRRRHRCRGHARGRGAILVDDNA